MHSYLKEAHGRICTKTLGVGFQPEDNEQVGHGRAYRTEIIPGELHGCRHKVRKDGVG